MGFNTEANRAEKSAHDQWLKSLDTYDAEQSGAWMGEEQDPDLAEPYYDHEAFMAHIRRVKRPEREILAERTNNTCKCGDSALDPQGTEYVCDECNT